MKIQSERRTTEVGKKYALERKHRFDGKDLRLIMRSVRRKVHFSCNCVDERCTCSYGVVNLNKGGKMWKTN